MKIPVVNQRTEKAFLLIDPTNTALDISQSESGITVSLPDQAPDPIAPVMCIRFETNTP